ncbi:MAG: hypothetical protein IPO41_18065 [Acidobacteria bacterium]|nr:hypothetical protein [Acidobacteriota bacterium]
MQYLVFNAQTGPLENPKVRQAIGYAIDRDKIVAELLSGQAKVASSILPSQSWAYSPGTAYKFDPAKANHCYRSRDTRTNRSISNIVRAVPQLISMPRSYRVR